MDRILRRGDSAEGHFLLGAALFTAGNYPGAVDGALQGGGLESGRAVAAVLLRAGAALHRRRRRRDRGLPQRTRRQSERFRRQLPARLHSGAPRQARRGSPAAGARRPGAARFARSTRRAGERLPHGSARRKPIPESRAGTPAPPVAHARSEPPRKAGRAGLRQLYLPQAAWFGGRSEAHRRSLPRPRGFSPGLHPRGPCRGRRREPVAEHHQYKGRHLAGPGRAPCPKSRSMPRSASAN